MGKFRDCSGIDRDCGESDIEGMLDGNMCFGVVGDRLMLRLGADLAERTLRRTHVQPMDFTGRPMTGMVFVAPEALHGKALHKWVEPAIGFRTHAAVEARHETRSTGAPRVGPRSQRLLNSRTNPHDPGAKTPVAVLSPMSAVRT